MTGIAMFSVLEKSSGKWVGRLGPWYPEGWPDHEVGWGIAREHWGKGYATEGAAAAMDYAFDVLGWTQVIHCIEEEQPAASQGRGEAGSARALLRAREDARCRTRTLSWTLAARCRVGACHAHQGRGRYRSVYHFINRATERLKSVFTTRRLRCQAQLRTAIPSSRTS